VAVVAPTHPLCGQRLQANRFRRQDGELLLAVVLPDGSPGFISAAVTDVLGVGEAKGGREVVMTVEGARRLRSLVEAAKAKAPPSTSRRRPPRPWKVVRHAHGADPFVSREWVYSAHPTEGTARRARDRVRAVMARASGHAEAGRWAWSVVEDPAGALVNRPEDGA
jgi:hypothetical protein